MVSLLILDSREYFGFTVVARQRDIDASELVEGGTLNVLVGCIIHIRSILVRYCHFFGVVYIALLEVKVVGEFLFDIFVIKIGNLCVLNINRTAVIPNA